MSGPTDPTTTAADQPTPAASGEVWQDSDGCCLAYVRGEWFAFGRPTPLDLSKLPDRDQPARRLLVLGGDIAPERLREPLANSGNPHPDPHPAN